MEANGKNPNGKASETEKVEVEVLNGDEKDDESDSLLSPRRGGISKWPKKTRGKVQWNDRNGNKLVEVLEFQPSDTSDSDDEDSDSCICTIIRVSWNHFPVCLRCAFA